MAESVDASVSNTDRETCAGSTPARSTKVTLWRKLKSDFFVLVERVYKYMGWWKLISRGLCVKWCCFFCFSFAKWEFEWLSSGYAIRELLRARIYAHAFPEFFIFCCHKCHRGVCKTSFYSISFMPHRLESAEKSIVCADEMMKFCVVNWCFYISLSKNVSNRVVFRWNTMWYLCSVTLVTAKKTKSL